MGPDQPSRSVVAMTWNHVEDALREVGVHVWFEDNSLRFKLGDYTCSLYFGWPRRWMGHSPI